MVIGVSFGVAAFRLFAPSEVFPVTYRRGRSAHLDVSGARGEAIRRALEDQLGLTVTEVVPVGLSGSAGSTPLRLTAVEGGTPPYLFGKLYSRTHLRSDRWYKLGRELLYGRLEDEKPFNTVRRLVQQEDYALRVVRDAGVPGARSYGFVELTPEREYLLVAEFLEGGVELGDAEVDDALIDEALGVVRRLWDAGLAHRDIKPANLMVRDGRILLIDVAFAELRPTPWRQAVDLANMMLCLALRSSAHQVYDRALRQFTVEEISEAFAAARGLALPSQLRRALRAEGRDLHGEFLGLLPERPRPIKVQRWTLRRIVVALATAALVVLLVPNAARLFGNDDDTRTPVHVDPWCEELEAMWLQAQAVPTAELVPCVASLPVGWSFRTLTVNEGRSTITVDHDRAGAKAIELRFAEACDVTGAEEVAADVPGARRFERGPRRARTTCSPATRCSRAAARRYGVVPHRLAGGRGGRDGPGRPPARLRHPLPPGPSPRPPLRRPPPPRPAGLTFGAEVVAAFNPGLTAAPHAPDRGWAQAATADELRRDVWALPTVSPAAPTAGTRPWRPGPPTGGLSG